MTPDLTISPDQLKGATGLDDDDIVDAVDELEKQGFVETLHTIGEGFSRFHVCLC